MKKETKLLGKGLFEKGFMDSKVKTRTMTTKEKILGHLIGPLGIIMLSNVIGALGELYYTEQVPIDSMYGTGTYMAMCMSRQILSVFMGLLTGWLVQHTNSRQGRIRPWFLIGGMICTISATFMFLVPDNADNTYLAIIWGSTILFYVLGMTLYNLATNTIVSLCTRDYDERTNAYFLRKLSLTIISGILIGLVLMCVLYYQFLINNRDAWWKLIMLLSILAFPLVWIEYFWTRERVTEDAKAREKAMNHATSYPIKEQFKALLTDKYYMLMLVFTIITGCLECMKGGNVNTNYCRWVLGADAQNNLQLIYTIVSGIPVGIGAMIAYPISKKIGVRRFTVIGFSLAIVANIFGLLNAYNPTMAMGAGLVKNIGLIPYAFVTASLFTSALDNVEYRTGMRLDGMLGVAVIGMVQGLLLAPFSGLYETILLKFGFNAQLAGQPVEVTNWISFCFWGLDIIIAIVAIVIMCFYDIDKKLPIINAELAERRKQAVIDSGEEWIEPEELERIEREQVRIEHEKNRIDDLRTKCNKKGLDFDTENAKYLQEQKERERRRAEKEARKGKKKK